MNDISKATPYGVYWDILEEAPHLLIAGATGTGKSCLINELMYTRLCMSGGAGFILIDPKRVELIAYRDLPHTMLYADTPAGAVDALQKACRMIDRRFESMQAKRQKLYDGADIYIIIDELLDLVTAHGKQIKPLIQYIAQLGRAAKVHMIAATQCPLASVIPTPIKCNFDYRIALRCSNAQNSRNIIDEAGAERLPRYGYALYKKPLGVEKIALPVHTDDELEYLIGCYVER